MYHSFFLASTLPASTQHCPSCAKNLPTLQPIFFHMPTMFHHAIIVQLPQRWDGHILLHIPPSRQEKLPSLSHLKGVGRFLEIFYIKGRYQYWLTMESPVQRVAWKKKVNGNCSIEVEIVNCEARIDQSMTDSSLIKIHGRHRIWECPDSRQQSRKEQ